MKPIITYTIQSNNPVSILTSDGKQITTSNDLTALLQFFTDNINTDFLHVAWDVDELAGCVLKFMQIEDLQKIRNTNKCLFSHEHKRYKIFYIPEKMFAVKRATQKESETTIYHLKRYFPKDHESSCNLPEYARRLCIALDAVGFDPHKLTSPVAIYENGLRELDLPVNMDFKLG